MLVSRRIALAAAGAAVVLATAVLAQSQAPGFDPRLLMQQPMSDAPDKVIALVAVTLAPGAQSPPHTHPGDCIGSVVEGAIELHAAGQPARNLKTGDPFSNPRGTVHQFVNTSGQPVRMLTTVVHDKDKPRLQVVPAMPK
jgi:quercetin dioxygenase-like cupin family protein